jgi:VanZ family protein
MRVLCVAAGWGIAALVVWLSVTPSPPQIDIEQGDKLGHIAAYGTLMFWFCLLYRRRATRIAYALLWIAMGVGLEFIQRRLGYRTFDVYDMCADAVGVLVGWAAALTPAIRSMRSKERD